MGIVYCPLTILLLLSSILVQCSEKLQVTFQFLQKTFEPSRIEEITNCPSKILLCLSSMEVRRSEKKYDKHSRT
jgi:hypothetical protein